MKTHTVLVKMTMTITAPNKADIDEIMQDLDGGFVSTMDGVDVVDEEITSYEPIDEVNGGPE